MITGASVTRAMKQTQDKRLSMKKGDTLVECPASLVPEGTFLEISQLAKMSIEVSTSTPSSF